MDSDGKDKKTWSWEIKLQLIFWGVVAATIALVYATQANGFRCNYGVLPLPHLRTMYSSIYSILAYNLADYWILLFTCILFEPLFAYKRKSVDLPLIYLLVVQAMVMAVTRYGTMTYPSIENMVSESSSYMLVAVWVCIALIIWKVYSFYVDMKTGKKYFAASRVLVLLLLIYVTFNTFYDRWQLIEVAKSYNISKDG